MLPSIEARLKDVLDETRLAMLGTQLLMGIQFHLAFAQTFEQLPAAFRWLDGVALLLILAAAAILLATPSFHQISERGHATTRILNRASLGLRCALLPLSLALGADVAIGLATNAGAMFAALAGAAFAGAALFLWYALPLSTAARHRPREEQMEDKQPSLEACITEALTELRVILPGAQALFGFQLTAVLTESFARLSEVSRIVHLASLGLVAVAIVMLIAPAAYHRIAAGGNAEESVLRYAVRMMLPAVGLLALGLIGNAYVTVRWITKSDTLALAIGGGAAVAFATLLYGLPLASRYRNRHPSPAVGARS